MVCILDSVVFAPVEYTYLDFTQWEEDALSFVWFERKIEETHCVLWYRHIAFDIHFIRIIYRRVKRLVPN
jgi:hypothetical protein